MLHVSVLAATATVIFSGLIVHHETDKIYSTRRAVILEDKDHKPRLLIKDADRVGDSGGWRVNSTGSTNIKWDYDLSDRNVQIIGPTGGVMLSDAFKLHVPSLPEILKPNVTDDLLDDVKNANLGLGKPAMAYVGYTGGTLDVKTCFPEEINFDPPVKVKFNGKEKDPRCLAKEVVLSGTVGGNWRIEDADNSSMYIEIKPDAIIEITNQSMVSAAHQKMYSNVLKKKTTIRDIKRTGQCCKDACDPNIACSQLPPQAGATVECTNSQWP